MAALFAHRLRRAVVLTPSLRHFSSISAAPVQRFSVFNPSSTSSLSSNTSSPKPNPPVHHHFRSERAFRSTAATLFSRRGSYNDRNYNDDQIDPDAILFEGCDYNHWLITMEFPKDSKPSPEEMVETYVQTAAKVLGSVEEAKKKIYACSTTTYQGFQVEVSEEMSEKFRGLPGVVFILPDSYIDPVNKEYGGDKYINGTIIPRPPPVQYGRQGGRYNDRNRDYNRPPRGINNASAGQNNFQGDRGGPMPDYQRNHNQGEQRNYYPPRQTDFQPREQRNYSHPPQGGNFGPGGDNGNYSPPQGGNFGPGGGNGNYSPPQGGNFGPGGGGDYSQGTDGNYKQGTSGNYGQGVGGNYGQGGDANYRQGVGGNYGQVGDGNYGQGAGGNYGQGGGRNFDHVSGTGNYSHGGGRNYREGTIADHGQGLGQQGNYEDIQNAGTTQGRY